MYKEGTITMQTDSNQRVVKLIELDKILESNLKQIKEFDLIRDTVLAPLLNQSGMSIKYEVRFGKTAKYLDIVTLSRYRSFLGKKREENFNINFEDDILYIPSSIDISNEEIYALSPEESKTTKAKSNVGGLILDYINDERYGPLLKNHDKKISIKSNCRIRRGMRSPLPIELMTCNNKETLEKFKAIGNKDKHTGQPMSDSVPNACRIHSEAIVALARDIMMIWEEYRVIVDIESDKLVRAVNYMIWELSYATMCGSEKNIETAFNIKFKPNTLIGFSHGTVLDSIHAEGALEALLSDSKTKEVTGYSFTKEEISMLSMNSMDQNSIVLGVVNYVDGEDIGITMLNYSAKVRVPVEKVFKKKDFFKPLDINNFKKPYSPNNRIFLPYSVLSNTKFILSSAEIWDFIHPVISEFSIPQEIIDRLEPIDWER